MNTASRSDSMTGGGHVTGEPEVFLQDVTLRDGMHALRHRITPKTVAAVAAARVARVPGDRQRHGADPWDLMIVETAGAHTDGPNPCLGVIDKSPFYAATIVLSDLGTKGGLVTDDHARVLRPDGSVITGLYASGNTMAPMSGRIYPGAGGPVGSSMAFSYIAALDMAGERVGIKPSSTLAREE